MMGVEGLRMLLKNSGRNVRLEATEDDHEPEDDADHRTSRCATHPKVAVRLRLSDWPACSTASDPEHHAEDRQNIDAAEVGAEGHDADHGGDQRRARPACCPGYGAWQGLAPAEGIRLGVVVGLKVFVRGTIGSPDRLAPRSVLGAQSFAILGVPQTGSAQRPRAGLAVLDRGPLRVTVTDHWRFAIGDFDWLLRECFQ